MGEWFWKAGEWWDKYKYLFFVSVTPIVLVYNWLFVSAELIGPFTKENLSYFADAFAPLNSLFSGMALVGIVFAIVLQKKELDATREELKVSADSLRDSAQTMRTQQARHRCESFRKATPILVSGLPRDAFIAGNGDKFVRTWILTNHSGSLFHPKIDLHLEEPLPFHVRWYFPTVLEQNGTVEFSLILPKDGGENITEIFTFSLGCIDSGGHSRKQVFECVLDNRTAIECVDPDLRLSEHEIDGEQELEYVP